MKIARLIKLGIPVVLLGATPWVCPVVRASEPPMQTSDFRTEPPRQTFSAASFYGLSKQQLINRLGVPWFVYEETSNSLIVHSPDGKSTTNNHSEAKDLGGYFKVVTYSYYLPKFTSFTFVDNEDRIVSGSYSNRAFTSNGERGQAVYICP